MKLLHTADWHLDAPMAGFSPEAGELLRRQLRAIPGKIAKLCKTEGCDLLIVAGDIFDGPCTHESLTAVRSAFASLSIPVVITPGNHDPYTDSSPYKKEQWPENVYIFKESQMTSFPLPDLSCRIYGGAFTGPDCPGLLKRFRAEGEEKYHIGILHGEVATAASPYCPITRHQIQESGLHYLALGHIHKQGSLTAGETVCVWPGCPMGKGYDELGIKGVILTELEETVRPRFLPLDTPCFYDEKTEAGEDPAAALRAMLPALETQDHYRITLTGYSTGLDLNRLKGEFPQVPNLILRDETLPESDIWGTADQDSLEGVYFSLLQEAAQSESETLRRRAMLAARISRKILDGQEVKLP